jgi:thymidylate synthase (FAD)
MSEIKCLDKGYVRLLNIASPNPKAVGCSEVAAAARVSYGNFEAERTQEQDYKLCEYLMKNKHTSPFEMVVVWLELKLPIFVARQFVRHRTQALNEISARYVQLSPDWYIPDVVGGKPIGGSKQGQSDTLDRALQEKYRVYLNSDCQNSYDNYEYFIKKGVAPEHARLFLHVNHYTQWVSKTDLHNMMHFLNLRLDAHAQVEAQVYAKAIYDLLSEYIPDLMEIFDKYRRTQDGLGKS